MVIQEQYKELSLIRNQQKKEDVLGKSKKKKRKGTWASKAHVEEEGPRRGFSKKGWKEKRPRARRAQSPAERPGQSLTNMVTKKATRWTTTKRETTHVFSDRRRPKNGSRWVAATTAVAESTGSAISRLRWSFADDAAVALFSIMEEEEFYRSLSKATRRRSGS